MVSSAPAKSLPLRKRGAGILKNISDKRVMSSAQNPEIGSKKGFLRVFDEDEKIKKSVFLRTYKAKMVDLDRVHHFL